ARAGTKEAVLIGGEAYLWPDWLGVGGEVTGPRNFFGPQDRGPGAPHAKIQGPGPARRETRGGPLEEGPADQAGPPRRQGDRRHPQRPKTGKDGARQLEGEPPQFWRATRDSRHDYRRRRQCLADPAHRADGQRGRRSFVDPAAL